MSHLLSDLREVSGISALKSGIQEKLCKDGENMCQVMAGLFIL